MGRLVHRHKEFIVIEDDYNYGKHIVINTKGQYACHAHVHSLKTCKKLLILMDKKTVPFSSYLRGSALRLSLDYKYQDKILWKIEKDKQKLKFVKIQKQVSK